MPYRYSLRNLKGKTVWVTNISLNTFRGTSPSIQTDTHISL